VTGEKIKKAVSYQVIKGQGTSEKINKVISDRVINDQKRNKKK
jgi:hypothetical protein